MYKELAKTKNLVRAYFLAEYAVDNDFKIDENKITGVSVSKRGIYFNFEKHEKDTELFPGSYKYLGKGKELISNNSLRSLRYNYADIFCISTSDVLDEIQPKIEQFLNENDPYSVDLEDMVIILKEKAKTLMDVNGVTNAAI